MNRRQRPEPKPPSRLTGPVPLSRDLNDPMPFIERQWQSFIAEANILTDIEGQYMLRTLFYMGADYMFQMLTQSTPEARNLPPDEGLARKLAEVKRLEGELTEFWAALAIRGRAHA